MTAFKKYMRAINNMRRPGLKRRRVTCWRNEAIRQTDRIGAILRRSPVDPGPGLRERGGE